LGEDRVIESWINTTLSEAQNLEIPGVLTKPSHKHPLTRYGIDRNQLVQASISLRDVDRIYRSLFVYSIGFYEMLQNCVAHTKYKNSLMGSIWKVFAVLLEYCCKANYQTIVQRMAVQQTKDSEEVEAKNRSEQERLFEQERLYRDEIYELKKSSSTYKSKYQESEL
jgi:hypothetical protein